MQTHLKGFGLENFRVFKDYTWFDFAPITILTGPNNSGKSSLIKALLLLSNNANDLLNVGTRLNFDDAALKTLGSNSCHNDILKEIIVKLPLNYGYRIGSNSIRKNIFCKIHFQLNIYKELSIKKFSFSDEFEEELFHIGLDNDFYYCENGDFNIKLFKEIFDDSYKDEVFENVSSWSIRGDNRLRFILEDKNLEHNIELYREVVETLHLDRPEIIFSYFFNIFYLPIIRGIQKRVYTIHEDPIWYEVFTSVNQLLKIDTVYDPTDPREESYDNYQYTQGRKDFIVKWLNCFGISEDISFHHDEIANTIFPLIGKKHLSDMGLGINQVVSLILFVCYKPLQTTLRYRGMGDQYDPIVILEEPETNLHPNFQSKLADFFVEAAETFGIQFIIETHSEYLIRRMQFLTLKTIVKPENTIIYYFKDPNDNSNEQLVKKINIQKDGRLTGPFGKGFLDETGRLMASLLTGEYLN